MTDVNLFADVVARMQQGGHYYEIMGDALRHGPGPAGSVFNWRPPLLYVVLSWLPWTPSADVWGWYLTEVWAGLAIAASSLTAPSFRRTSAGLAGVAVLLRELALPYLLIRVWMEGRSHRRTWTVVLGLVAVYYAAHVGLVLQHQQPSDIVGPPWLAFQGVHFLLATVSPNPFMLVLGSWGAWAWWLAVVAASSSTRLARADRLTLLVYLLAFAVLGRADTAPIRGIVHTNAYWGYLLLPLQAILIWQAGMQQLDRVLLTKRSPAPNQSAVL